MEHGLEFFAGVAFGVSEQKLLVKRTDIPKVHPHSQFSVTLMGAFLV